MIKQNNIRDYNNFDITNSQNSDPINVYSNTLAEHDSIHNNTINRNTSATLVNNTSRDFTSTNRIEL